MAARRSVSLVLPTIALTFRNTSRTLTANVKGETPMDPAELHAKSVIVAALITAHAVEIPRLPPSGEKDDAALRLRALTEYVY